MYFSKNNHKNKRFFKKINIIAKYDITIAIIR